MDSLDTSNLPALLSRAGQRLLDARSSAEVLEAKRLAEAALHYAKVTQAANDTHADCLRIITRAEMRMADEIDRGQASGDVAGKGRPENVQGSDIFRCDICHDIFSVEVWHCPTPGCNHHWPMSRDYCGNCHEAELPPVPTGKWGAAPTTFDSLDLDRRRVAEWREMRDAGPEAVETAIGKALSEGRAPTKKEILDAAKSIRAEETERRRDERISRLAEISKGNVALDISQRYPVIYADPPWQYENPPIGATNRAIENHYPTMTLEEICALPVAEMATDDAILYLWATSPKLAECMRVIDAWGFIYRTSMVWKKDKIGMGYHVRNQHEILLIAKRGEIPPPPINARPPSVLDAPRREHSAKPEEFYSIIERMYPELPKIELFARAERNGWAVWGNQAASNGD